MVPYIEFLNTNAALGGPVPDMIIAVWQEVAAGHRATGQYTSSMSFTRMFPYGGNPLRCAVANTTPYAAVLEEGHAGFHLPSRIDWGAARSARRSKRGVPYLRIPFRHMTPGRESEGISSLRARTAMPKEIYTRAMAQFRGGARRATFGDYGRLSRPYRIMNVPQWLVGRALSQEGQPGYTWRKGKFEGMRRIDAKVGGQSHFMTWRTLSADSVGWWIPALQGFHFAQQVVERIKGPVSDLLGVAVARDIAEIITLKYATSYGVP